MAQLVIQGADLVVKLSTLEKIGALSGDVSVPLSAIKEVRVTDAPYKELRGMRVGTGIPFVIVLGRMVYAGGTDFVAVYGRGRTTIVELEEGQTYRRLFVTGDSGASADEIRMRSLSSKQR